MRVLDERGLCTEEKGRGKVSSGIFDTSLSPSHFPGAGRAEPRVQERGSNVLDVAFRGPPLGAAARGRRPRVSSNGRENHSARQTSNYVKGSRHHISSEEGCRENILSPTVIEKQ